MKHLVFVAGLTCMFALASIDAEAQGFRRADCDLSTGHFLVSSAVTYLDGAGNQSDPVKRERMLGDALRTLNDAIARGETDNPAVWYFYGRYYVMRNDLLGADSMFALAEQLAPQCAQDIGYYRQFLWVPALNEAMDSMRAGAYDGAKILLKQAFALMEEDNLAPYYLGRIYGMEGELDSAVHYFKEVVAIGTADSARLENYEISMFNVGLIYSMAGQWDSSVVWYDRYRDEVNADDPQAVMGLAEALKESGQTDRAMALYDSVMIRAPEMDAIDLFRAGEALFIAGQYEKSGEAFRLGLEKNPYFRPALYNLANVYLAICNDESRPQEERDAAAVAMEGAARRLVEVDPLNSESMDLLAAAFQLQAIDDSTLAVLERREALTYEVNIDVQHAVDGGYLVQGRLENSEEADVSVPAITFEFLDGAGNVITTEATDPTTLEPMRSSTFSLTGVGEGLVAVRYRVGG